MYQKSDHDAVILLKLNPFQVSNFRKSTANRFIINVLNGQKVNFSNETHDRIILTDENSYILRLKRYCDVSP